MSACFCLLPLLKSWHWFERDFEDAKHVAFHASLFSGLPRNGIDQNQNHLFFFHANQVLRGDLGTISSRVCGEKVL